MTRSEAPGAMLATLHLLTASLAPSLDSLALARPAAEGTLRRQICTYIDERVTQQDLSSELICTRLSKKTCQLNPASVEEVVALASPVARRTRFLVSRLLGDQVARADAADDAYRNLPTSLSDNSAVQVPVARYGECAILMHLHELGRDPVILGNLLKG